MFTKLQKRTGDLIGNKINDIITSVGKTKSKQKEDEVQEMYIKPEKRQQIIDDLSLFQHHIKIEHEKITNLLDTTSDNASIFNTEKWIEAYDQSGGIYSNNKQV